MRAAIEKHFKGDKVIWAVVLLLSFVSIAAVYSATQSLAFRMERNTTYYLVKQFGVLALGILIIVLVQKVNYRRFMPIARFSYIFSIPLLAYTLAFGATLNEGSRWIKLPVINLTFQTSDMAKLALFMYLAKVLSTKQHEIQSFKKGFVPVILPVLIICGLIAPANLSTALMLMLTCALLLFIGRIKVSHILLLGFSGIVLIAGLYLTSKITGKGRAATWEKRVMSYTGHGTKSADEKDDDNFQINQAMIAIASGGVVGQGPGNSEAKDYLPHGYSDFIYANIIAEYGLIGGALVVFLYLLFLYRSIVIFKRCPFGFGAFLAVGLSMTLVFQAMLNMAVNVHLVPVTGLTLPLVSMGGSSIWFTSITIGIVLSVSRFVDEDVIPAQKKKASEAKLRNNQESPEIAPAIGS